MLTISDVLHVLILYCLHTPIPGYNSQKVSNLPLGTLTVEVEAALQCNPSIRASKTLTLDVPDNVKVGDLEGEDLESAFATCSDKCSIVVVGSLHSALIV